MATAELDSILARYTDPATGSVQGATFVAVDSKGHTIYCSSSGSRTADRSQPLTPDTFTWIASQSKLATAVAAMQVVEKGLIGLDDDARDVLPTLRDLKVLVGFEGDDGTEGSAENVSFDAVAKGETGSTFGTGPAGIPIFEDVKGPITLRLPVNSCPTLLDELFRPQTLSQGSAAALRTFLTNPGGMSPLWTVPDRNLMPVGMSLAGTVNSQNVPGKRRRGSVNWGGLPNLASWIDREAGLAAMDPECLRLLTELEEAVYKLLDEKETT